MRSSSTSKKTPAWFQGQIKNRRTVATRLQQRRLMVESLETRTLLAADLVLGYVEPAVPSIYDADSVRTGDALSLVESKTLDASVLEDSTLRPVQKDVQDLMLDDEQLVDAASEATTTARIVGKYVYYEGSVFAESGIHSALDTTRQLAVEGDEPLALTVENLLNTETGITGLVFEVADLATTSLAAKDFRFQVSPQGYFDSDAHHPQSWESAVDPYSIEVAGGSEEGQNLVVVRWTENAIENRWLRVTIESNDNTGLAESVTYYVGHLRGKTFEPLSSPYVSNHGEFFVVANSDIKAIRDQVGQTVSVESDLDINKDGIITFADIKAVGQSRGNQLTAITVSTQATLLESPINSHSIEEDAALRIESVDTIHSLDAVVSLDAMDSSVAITLSETSSSATGLELKLRPAVTSIEGAFVYHADSRFAALGGGDAIDRTTQLVREGSVPKSLGMDNLINSNRGINGLVFDIAQAAEGEITASSFRFQVSPTGVFNEKTNSAVNWQELETVPAEIVTNRFVNDSGLEVTRVTIVWPNETIMNQWLRVTVLPGSSTGLREPAVYYVGHLLGKNTDWAIKYDNWNSSGVFEVHPVDLEAIRDHIGRSTEAGDLYDIDKDGVVSFADIQAAKAGVDQQLRLSTLIVVTPNLPPLTAVRGDAGDTTELVAGDWIDDSVSSDDSAPSTPDVVVRNSNEDVSAHELKAVDAALEQVVHDYDRTLDETPSEDGGSLPIENTIIPSETLPLLSTVKESDSQPEADVGRSVEALRQWSTQVPSSGLAVYPVDLLGEKSLEMTRSGVERDIRLTVDTPPTVEGPTESVVPKSSDTNILEPQEDDAAVVKRVKSFLIEAASKTKRAWYHARTRLVDASPETNE